MSIEFAILSLLSSGPLSGYDLKKLFSESEALPWSGNNNQIYRSLVELHRSGLTDQEIQQPAEGPARKLYTLTPSGRDALREWLRSEPELPAFRAPIFARLVGSDLLTDEELDQLLSRYDEELRLKVIGLEELAAPRAAHRTRQRTPAPHLAAHQRSTGGHLSLRTGVGRGASLGARPPPNVCYPSLATKTVGPGGWGVRAAINYRSERGYQLAMEVYDRQLAELPVDAEQQRVPTSIGDTFVLSWGDAAHPPLVLLHGSAANSATWGADAARFAEHFRVYAIDLPGETGKSTPVRPPYAGPAYVEWLSDVLDALRIERAAVAGLSLGGWLALRFGAAHPSRVDRLAVLAPGGVAPARKKFLITAAVFQLLGRRGIERITRLVFSPQPPPPGVAEGFAFMLKHYRARRDSLPVISDEELSRISAPTLVLGGAKDALLDMPATCARLGSLVPNATIHLDPAGGHAILGEGARVVEFLAAPPTAAQRT